MNKKIDWTKPVQTVGGAKVTVLTTTREHDKFPVVTIVHTDGRDDVEVYTADGNWLSSGGHDDLDLINVPPERTREFRSFNSKGEGGDGGNMILGNVVASTLGGSKGVTDMYYGWEGILELIREDGKLVNVKFHPLTA